MKRLALLLVLCGCATAPVKTPTPWRLSTVTKVYGMCRSVHTPTYCECFTDRLMVAFPDVGDESITEAGIEAATAGCEEGETEPLNGNAL